jgi:hypothetical protein
VKLNPEREGDWQKFFEQNKWIFGYGLNYQILNQEQSQTLWRNASGSSRRSKGRRSDFNIRSHKFYGTRGDKNARDTFTTRNWRIRSGAWSLSKQLTDALSQIQTNMSTWDKQGSEHPQANITRV